MPLPRLLGISGSLRSGSHCTALLRAMPPLVKDVAHLDVLTLHDVPLYDAGLDGDAAPDGVLRFKQAISQTDGLVVVSPEYNYSIPGVLKNAIDWASRPGFKSPLRSKPALIVTASPGILGGVRAHAPIREALTAALARPIPFQQLAVPAIDKKIVEGQIEDEMTRQLLTRGLQELLAEVFLLGKR